MTITKDSTFHCFFEQSGTFKNEFKKLGYNAIDYDILNDYGETDVQIDLFAEIEKAYGGEKSVLYNINPETDYILAFFPCTFFQECNAMLLQGVANQQKTMSDRRKIDYVIKRHSELHDNYVTLSKMVGFCMDRNIPIIIENPAVQPHYLNLYWCFKPKFVDQDRTERGDKFKKPTQYWFINCEPKFNFLFEPQIIKKAEIVEKQKGNDRQRKRSEIEPEYANRFIREFILDGDYYGD